VPTTEIKRGLELIRLRQRRMMHVFMGIVPFVLVAAYVSTLPSPSGFEIPFILAAAAYGVLLLVYSLRLAFTECPGCQGFYHFKSWLDPFAAKCLHCGLPLE
jgi:uncharacterized membrane protein SpoIIM required for sporulation